MKNEGPKTRYLRLAKRQAAAIPKRKQKKRAVKTLCGHLRNFLKAGD